MGIMQSPVVLVVGSLHYDIMLKAPGLPRWDETMQGQSWQPKFGGKGGNQALAASRAGITCRMLGAVGEDAFAPFLRDGLRAGGVDDRFVAIVPGFGSGMSVAVCGPTGDYAAIIVSGANLVIDCAVLNDSALWDGVQVLVLQNEVSEALNLAAASEANRRGVRVVLNAAPARQLPAELAALVDVLVVNAVEAEMLGAGLVVDLASALEAAGILSKLCRTVVVTVGAKGFAMRTAAGEEFIQTAKPVIVQSSHGAGDAFIGALVAGMARGSDLQTACIGANDAAAAHVAGL